MLRISLVLGLLLAAATPVAAQDAETEAGAGTGAGEDTGADTGAGTGTTAPKVAVVLAGDPDPAMRSLARRVDDAIEGTLRRPFDPGLRAALRGEPGQGDDGLGGVRRERRRLGLGEARDAPVLAQLGRQASAVAVAVVRSGSEGPELVMLDVGAGAFFEGTLQLDESVADARVVGFVARRARAAARRTADPTVAAEARVPDAPEGPNPLADVEDGETGEDEEEPDLFEQIWPYLVAGALLAGMLTAIGIVAATDDQPQPVLRFVPGGR